MKERTSAQIIDDHGELFAGMPGGKIRLQTEGYSKGFIMDGAEKLLRRCIALPPI